jgi:hypothetical protein
MWSKTFWEKTAERAVKTFIQALLAAFGVGEVGSAAGVDLLSVDWPGALSLAGSAALLSVLFSALSSGRGDPESPSFLLPPK